MLSYHGKRHARNLAGANFLLLFLAFSSDVISWWQFIIFDSNEASRSTIFWARPTSTNITIIFKPIKKNLVDPGLAITRVKGRMDMRCNHNSSSHGWIRGHGEASLQVNMKKDALKFWTHQWDLENQITWKEIWSHVFSLAYAFRDLGMA